ncbi:glycosyl transferase family protein [Candidatus Magnetoovum chiemensis]|nr:glycosyl transferase family protein [Candidatus Magnetoovum chiemensis]
MQERLKKDTIIFICTPNMHHLVARRAINSIKATNLNRAHLIISDNQYDGSFSHPYMMEKYLRYAQKQNMAVIFLDDDVEINCYNWIDLLHEASQISDADIVGCTHIFENGEVNHEGYFIYPDGMSEPLMDFIFEREAINKGAVYVPTLCSALMFIKNPADYYFDLKYKKYQHDLDICMQAWQKNRKVASLLNLRIMHHLGYTAASNPNFSSTYYADSAYFAQKWADFIPEMLNIQQLKQYEVFNQSHTWNMYYKRAARVKHINKSEAAKMFNNIAENCYNEKVKSGALFHLYSIDGDYRHLENCLKYNPCHAAARKLLDEQGRLSPSLKKCNLSLDCRFCLNKNDKKMHILRLPS